MTHEEFLSAGGDQARPATYSDRKTATAWAMTFSMWDDTTWAAVECDGWYTVMLSSQCQPWMGQIIGRYRDGKKVSA